MPGTLRQYLKDQPAAPANALVSSIVDSEAGDAEAVLDAVQQWDSTAVTTRDRAVADAANVFLRTNSDRERPI